MVDTVDATFMYSDSGAEGDYSIGSADSSSADKDDVGYDECSGVSMVSH